MGPERVLPSSEEELGQERLSEPAADEWSGEDGEEEDGAPGEEEEDSAGYYYQPLNQEPDGVSNTPLDHTDTPTHADQLQEVQERIEVSSSSLIQLSLLGCLFMPICLPIIFGEFFRFHDLISFQNTSRLRKTL